MPLKFKALKNIMNVLMLLLLICFGLFLNACSQDVNSLIKKLNDEKPELRLETVSALGKLRDSRAVEPLIAVLKKEKDETVRARAAWALGWIEDSRAVEPLIATLKDENPHVRRATVKALGRIGKPAVEPLTVALKDENPDIRKGVAGALGETEDPGVVEPLVAALKDRTPKVRREAVRALGRVGKPAVEPLIVALKDEDLHFRLHAVWALGEIKDPRAIGALITALNDKDPNVIGGAGVSLGGIGKPAVEPLIAALKDEKPRIRWGAAWALQWIKDPRAVEPLIGALEDENSHVRTHAEMALMEITGTDFGDNPEEWRKWWEENKETFPKPFLVGVPLSGAGVESEPPPEERIAEILDFFDASTGTGDLVGNGPGGSAESRLNALRNIIEAAGDLIEVGDTAGACQQLPDVYERSDGEFPPPDFVTGDDAPELAIMVQNLMTYLGCPDKL